MYSQLGNNDSSFMDRDNRSKELMKEFLHDEQEKLHDCQIPAMDKFERFTSSIAYSEKTA